MEAIRVMALVGGAFVVAATVASAVRTVILPRGVPARISRAVFVVMRRLFLLRVGRRATYQRRDQIMALYAPLSLLVLLVVWEALVLAGFTLVFWGLGGESLRAAFTLSGSSLLTLGFERPANLLATILVFVEAALGLILLAMLITYLPSIYAAFSRREAAVTALEVRAGSPPSGVEMIERFTRLDRLERLEDVWLAWEGFFVDLEESHTSFPALTFFRSPQPDHSWVTAAGAVLDAAALVLSSVDIPREVQAEICIRAGYLALRRIGDFFQIPYDPDPRPTDPISVTREEYEDALDRLVGAGTPLKPDRDRSWRDFAGWRVNYDSLLLDVAGMTLAPEAPWSGDRAHRVIPRLFRGTSHRV